MALQAARNAYTRRGEGNSIWVVASADIASTDPDRNAEDFEPALSKVYRHPTFYNIPDGVENL